MSSFTSDLIVTRMGKRRWKLFKEFTYHIGSKCSNQKIMVPKGFETDFASVPRLFWVIASPWDAPKAAVLHDYLYQSHNWWEEVDNVISVSTRKFADDIFLEAMEVSGVAKWRRLLMYRAVRMFGWIAWR